jgi:FixJ family two-component response regulator
MNSAPTIGLIDDEPGMLKALQRLLKAEGFHVRPFGSASEFLDRFRCEQVDCLVLDVSMPGLNGLDLQEHLNRARTPLPIVFLTGQGDIPMSVRAIKAGAVNFLTKPVNDADLLAALHTALAEAQRNQEAAKKHGALRERFASLTPREAEVLRHVIAGKLNKQIAADLGTSEQTIKVHRMRITDKMGLPSVAELVRAADLLGVLPIGSAPPESPATASNQG